MKLFCLFSALILLLAGCGTAVEDPKLSLSARVSRSLRKSFTLSGTEWIPDPSDKVFSDSSFAVPENALLIFQKGTYTGQAGRNRFYGQYEEKGDGHCRFSKGSAAMVKSSEPIRKFTDYWMKILNSADRYVPEKETLRLYQGKKLLMKLKRKL